MLLLWDWDNKNIHCRMVVSSERFMWGTDYFEKKIMLFSICGVDLCCYQVDIVPHFALIRDYNSHGWNISWLNNCLHSTFKSWLKLLSQETLICSSNSSQYSWKIILVPDFETLLGAVGDIWLRYQTPQTDSRLIWSYQIIQGVPEL